MIRKLTVVALVVGVVASAAFAQPTTQRGARAEANTPDRVTPNVAHTFKDAEVIGFNDQPGVIGIVDAEEAILDGIVLGRSFKDALRENVDKETVNRVAQPQRR